MSFAWPIALAGLALLPLAAAAYLLFERKRREDARRFSNPALLPNLVAARPGWRRHAPAAIGLAALAVLIVGLARPFATLSVKKEEATVVMAIDTSRSMAADDLQPSRLEVARAAAIAFLDEVPETYPIAIVAFSTRADVVLPPTTDREAARTALTALRLGSGTAIGDAITTSLEAVARTVPRGEEPPPATILLLSDGAQTAGGTEPLAAARRALEAKVPVSTVALGTSEAVVEVPLPGGLRERVVVTPDLPTLRRIAEETGGRFYEAPDAEQLSEVYRELGSRLRSAPERQEITSAFAAGGLVLLLAGGLLSALWFRRLP
jgi:Ca-activated chloride channel family protein